MTDAPVFVCKDIHQFMYLEGAIGQVLDLKDIKQSAASGCKLCRVIMASLYTQEVGRDDDFCISLGCSRSGLKLFHSNGNFRSTGTISSDGDCIELVALDDCGLGTIRKGKAVSESTGSVAALGTASKWLHSCLTEQKHSHCRSTATNVSRVPFRILEIVSPATVVLRETSDLAPMTSYACLSYCWGGKSFLRTTKANKNDHLKGIETNDLPLTFREAAIVVLRLGMKYLWIDSLCIIQDDPQDWNTQAAMMADIYRNATITISAAASKNPEEGLFRLSTESHQLRQIEHEIPECPKVYQRSNLDHYWYMREYPLFRRGWIMQERLLSRRILHFGAEEIFWECIATKACECGGHDGDSDTRKSLRSPSRLASASEVDLIRRWHETITEYSTLKLTEESDVFPAISGFAKLIGDAYHQKGQTARYLAGLWTSSFIEDCSWTVYKAQCFRRPISWRAPSFSWASVVADQRPGFVEFLHDGFITSRKVYSRLEHSESRVVGEDPLGKMQGGFIILIGPLFETVLSKGSNAEEDAWVMRTPKTELECWILPDYEWDTAGDHDNPEVKKVFCLQLMSTSESIVVDHTRNRLLCLILRLVRKGEEQAYERIGLAIYVRGTPPQEGESWFYPDVVPVTNNARVKII